MNLRKNEHTILRGVNVEVRSLVYSSVHSHIDTLLSFTFVSFWFFPHCLPFSRFFYFGANSKKRAHFCRLPTHIHTLTVESERRSHLSHMALSCEFVCLEKFIVKNLMAHTHTHTNTHDIVVDSDDHYSHAHHRSHAWHICCTKEATNQNKIYRQLLSATHTNACDARTHWHSPLCVRV